ncbi:sensor histidine kinase [Hymenobacter caeli]|uniref:histidine kinase n=1 Tax=Hymenobacter caeli TaxID=2735894 RepID=A0ABX2FRL8_9BACT|nr:ATP-binding protein [Hymenobacter caeli]NRT19823.1 signal transduction histidine kinase [Hymenobacter caeli]
MLYLSPALGISLFLAREFALDAVLLQVKLGEVERLSAQTLAQEQDKQALLANQNETLEQQVAQRTQELQGSLTRLQATQAQLVQAEKMAGLGELTAGIAHEIQNPLNFVNNFAEVSAELVGELAEEQQRPARDPALEAELLGDLKQNLGKISHHGQRAASIVRGMLEHSRASTGERTPSDLNALCDEYLRLAYHGLRAKDKAFNAALSTDFAPDLPAVNVVGPDIGRVLLNLLTNAFYAVRQRQRAGEAGYAPRVGVSTRRVGGQVEIRVADNGTGMPAAVQAKIFQPFFTTKPTGEGTGLGLSLSHDIIAQGHGGTLGVESREGEGTEFVIFLPI